VFDWPADGKLVVKGLPAKVERAELLDGGMRLNFESPDGAVTVMLPEKAQDAIDTVVVLQIAGKK
jgi:alpha-L-fucosidase